ncbi:Hemolysin-type calcium-binding repeat-containing protein [Gemmobacter aquatilis]|uniref:Hemolysin-type calcium-binding repeat-containing protein n=1 Tax=Gemmobacter aquatilis TaxID=933059 RepID=A0A1H8NP29_9RHOB|nr:hypothetical protein [Gemmobacter aquatilis]SEO31346.1 Hemolysin-type calcium-binding repeat-containing protein [Gemmobacter aquatilis]
MPNVVFPSPSDSSPWLLFEALRVMISFIDIASETPHRITGTASNGWSFGLTGSGFQIGPGSVIGQDFIVGGTLDTLTVTYSPSVFNPPYKITFTNLGMDMADLLAAASALSSLTLKSFLGGFDWNITLNGSDDMLRDPAIDVYSLSLLGDDTIHANGGDDHLFASDGADQLFGGRGADSLLGGRGNDWINGDEGADVLNGGENRDILTGGAGADILTGGLGGDRLIGGQGIDIFVFARGDGADIISNFQDGTDQLDLRGVGAFTIEDGARGAVITYGQSSIELIGISAANLNGHDFL